MVSPSNFEKLPNGSGLDGALGGNRFTTVDGVAPVLAAVVGCLASHFTATPSHRYIRPPNAEEDSQILNSGTEPSLHLLIDGIILCTDETPANFAVAAPTS